MIIDMTINDIEWLQILSDLEDIGDYDALQVNLKLRTHLTGEKRALGLYHLKEVN